MISERVEITEIIDLTKQFIQTPSTRFEPRAQADILNLAHKYLGTFAFEFFEVDGVKSSLYYNTTSRPEKFRLILNSHLDVVSGSPAQYKPFEKDGNLYGRGAADMKAAAATQILVFSALTKNLSCPVALQLTTDEEIGGFKGTGHQVEQGVLTDFMVTGESTNLDICNENKGVLVFQLDIDTKKPAHAAYLWNGDNALVHANRFLSELWEFYPIPSQDEWRTTVNVAAIQTPNTEHNKVPDKVSVLLDFRHILEDSASDITKRIAGMMPENTKLSLKAQGVVPYTGINHPDLQTLANSINYVTGRDPKYIAKNGASDARFYSAVDTGAIEFGPAGEGLHSEEESIEIDSLRQYAKILEHFLLSLK